MIQCFVSVWAMGLVDSAFLRQEERSFQHGTGGSVETEKLEGLQRVWGWGREMSRLRAELSLVCRG